MFAEALYDLYKTLLKISSKHQIAVRREDCLSNHILLFVTTAKRNLHAKPLLKQQLQNNSCSKFVLTCKRRTNSSSWPNNHLCFMKNNLLHLPSLHLQFPSHQQQKSLAVTSYEVLLSQFFVVKPLEHYLD